MLSILCLDQSGTETLGRFLPFIWLFSTGATDLTLLKIEQSLLQWLNGVQS